MDVNTVGKSRAGRLWQHIQSEVYVMLLGLTLTWDLNVTIFINLDVLSIDINGHRAYLVRK